MFPTDTELAKYVQASNAIEGIDAKPGSKLFDNHFQVAKLLSDERVDNEYWLAEDIHKILMHGILAGNGHYRKSEAVIQKINTGEVVSQLPSPQDLPRLMERYNRWLYKVFLGQVTELVSAGDVAFTLHLEGLCIHPFVDGNGRTFRLLWNHLRVRCGLPWYTLENIDRQKYYTAIRRYETEIFQI